MNIADAIGLAPSLQKAVYEICDVLLAERRSLIIVIPDGVSSTDVFDYVRSELGRRDADIRELVPLEDGMSTAQSFAMTLGLNLSESGSTSQVESILAEVENQDHLPDVLCLEYVESTTPQQQLDWQAFLCRWADFMRRRMNSGETTISICAVGKAQQFQHPLERSNQMLETYYWWGLASIVDVQMMCRAFRFNDECRELWRENILPHIAASDTALADYLWDKITDEPVQIRSHLCEYANDRGWDKEALYKWNAAKVCRHTHPHNSKKSLASDMSFRELWVSGAVHWTIELGIELNTAAVATLGRYDIVDYRLWRGQVHCALPVINRLRLAACDILLDACGEDWETKLAEPIDENERNDWHESPYNCEFGHLRRLLASRPTSSKWSSWRTIIERATIMRNNLAHYKPVSYASFEQLWQFQSKLPM